MSRYSLIYYLFFIFPVANAIGLLHDYTEYPIYHQNRQIDEVLSKFNHLSARQLLDTAKYYNRAGVVDTALMCYNLLIGVPAKENDVEVQKLKVEAMNNSAVIHFWMCDYLKSYELLIRALNLCEEYDYDAMEFRIMANIGNIYFRFKEYDLSKSYYSRALKLTSDTTYIMLLYNNIGEAEVENGRPDSATHYLNRALNLTKRHDSTHLQAMLNTTASIYQKRGLYDSASHYFRIALDRARVNRRTEVEAENLSDLGNLFFETGQADSALVYINSSNVIAREKVMMQKSVGNNFCK